MYKYCFNCGKETEHEAGNVYTCKACGLRMYVNPKPTVNAVFSDELERILLTKRVIEPNFGMWDLPGGFIEPGETAKEALRREIKEELGIKYDGSFTYVGSYLSTYDYRPLPQPHPILIFVYYGQLELATNFTPHDDVSEAKWFSIGELPRDKFAYDAMGQTISDWLKLTKQT